MSPAIHSLPFADHAVNKNLVDTFISNFKGHQVSKVDTRTLDPAYPWFLQEQVQASADITVAYVNGKTFAYSCERTTSDVDCRTVAKFFQWAPIQLAATELESIQAFMRRARLNFGRLDFLRGNDGELYFLEVNTNGQWGWLDYKGDNGLVDAIVGEILAVQQTNAAKGSHSVSGPA